MVLQLSGNNQRIKAACAPSLDAARKIIKDLPENCYIPSKKSTDGSVWFYRFHVKLRSLVLSVSL